MDVRGHNGSSSRAARDKPGRERRGFAPSNSKEIALNAIRIVCKAVALLSVVCLARQAQAQPDLVADSVTGDATAVGASGLEYSWDTAVNGAEIIPQSGLYLTETSCEQKIEFEEYRAGTVVTDQYRDLGILFDVQQSGGLQAHRYTSVDGRGIAPPRPRNPDAFCQGGSDQ